MEGERLAAIQEAFRAARHERERRALALDFEQALAAVEAPARPAAVDVPVAEFFAGYLRHVKGQAAGEPFRLEPWQREFLAEFDRVDELGCRIYNRGLLGVPRGNGKSPIAAGRALYDLVTREDAPDVFTAAASRDQARIVLDYARGFAAQGPLAELLDVGRHEIRNPANGGALRSLSADGNLQHGLNPSSVTLDELHSFTTDRQRELFAAVDSSVHKRPGAYWLGITTASGDRGSLLGRLLTEVWERLEVERVQRGLWVAADEAGGTLVYWYGADETDDFDDEELWRAVNPASFVGVPALRKQRRSPSMARSTFARLHLNAEVAADRERWLEPEAWEKLADPSSRPDGAVCLGLDGSRTFDTTVVAWAARGPDGRVDVDCRIFSARPDAPHHELHEGGRINFDSVEAHVLDLFGRFNVREACFDPRYLERSADLLETRLPPSSIAPVEPQSKLMREALGSFERGVRDGTVRHRGDPAIAEHLAWAGCDRWDNGELRRVFKLDRSRPIDAAVAMALAYWRAQLDAAASVYDTRPVIVLEASGGNYGDPEQQPRLVDGEPVWPGRPETVTARQAASLLP